ncbi:MAG: FecR domain-containing protein [Chitinispirillaceae bacterium]|nr:FecR domain-containing protein [Chitinispirillaceae bacterium]
MHPSARKYGVLLFVTGVTIFLGTAATPPSDDQFTHKVAAGESISLICIDYYGYYSEALGKAVVAENPSIKNIDLIYPNQVLTLRKPVEGAKTADKSIPVDSTSAVTPSSRQSGPDASGEALFVKKMSITQGVVTCVEGTVRLRRSASAKPQPLKINSIVVPGNSIETGADGRAEIIINREAVVRLREGTTTVLESFRPAAAGSGKTRIGCSVGALWTKVKKFKDRLSRFELELPTAIAGVHGTVYETTVATDSSSEVKVFSGEVAVSGGGGTKATGAASAPGAPSEVAGPHEIAPPQEVTMEHWTRIVRAMQKMTIDKEGAPSRPVTFTKTTTGDWERWNNERDRRIAALFGERER